MWDGFVELIRVTIFGAAQLCAGSLGAGILFVSIALRLALLPVTLRLARQARDQRTRMDALQPAIETLQRRYAKDPARLMRETRALYAANGIRVFTPIAIIGLLLQVPLLGGLFSAVRSGLGQRVRFLWVTDLARTDALLLLAVTAITAGAMTMTPGTQTPGRAPSTNLVLMLSVVGTMVFLWSASSAIALSVGAGSLVSALQNWLLTRDRAPHARR